ncbi:hypothetical protein SAMN06265337_3778 [Hymenobacter gelipurpurascens]|uniref:Phosphopeptide-binding protein n=1 Tax=Hymenobacter gelipurpurascens TaxID=89968 RepID=A0A212UG53_9BACT|nr:hypothetical protein [Hymenobacter gelipurpurascens]SNC77196.1 hypothetical protein SAMN06265337_3778 [Hymenobacter gelipurpurascens]
MKTTTFLLMGFSLLSLAACDVTRKVQETPEEPTSEAMAALKEEASLEKNGIRLTPITDSPKMPEAQLMLKTPAPGSAVPSGSVAFDYDLTNFQLTRMTGGPHAEHLANSQQGQHIHNIVDNQPYTAHYTPEFSKPIPDGQHVVLSFLSRSYHESLKHRGAYDLRVITVGPGVFSTQNFDLQAPHLFYSRPKDVYKGKDTQKVMLDFYLVNTTLSSEGNKVRATINGTEFLLDQWVAYTMEGLAPGENTVKLELIDAKGNQIPGPYNAETRTFTLQP